METFQLFLFVLAAIATAAVKKDHSDFMLSRSEAHTFLRKRRATNSFTVKSECCDEMKCSYEELSENRKRASSEETFERHLYYISKRSWCKCGDVNGNYQYCENGKTKCSNGKIIPTTYLCDGDNDCSNNDDEDDCKLTVKYRKNKYTDQQIKTATSLQGSSNKFYGYVRLFGRPICSANFGLNDAKVICRSLGFSSKTTAFTFDEYGERYKWTKTRNSYILNNVYCNGNEQHLGSCSYKTDVPCSNTNAGVICFDVSTLKLVWPNDFSNNRIGEIRRGNLHIMGEKLKTHASWWSEKASIAVCKELYGDDEIIVKTLLSNVTFRTQQPTIGIDCNNGQALSQCRKYTGPITKDYVNPMIQCGCSTKNLFTILRTLKMMVSTTVEHQKQLKIALDYFKLCQLVNINCDDPKYTQTKHCKLERFLNNEMILSRNRKNEVIVIDNNYHYSNALSHHYVKTKLSDLKNDLSGLKGYITDFQQKLGSYFTDTAKFDEKVLKVDLKLLNSSLFEHGKEISNLNMKLKSQLSTLMSYVKAISVADIAESTISFLFSFLENILNPTKWKDFSFGDTFNSFLDSAQKIAKATSNLKKLKYFKNTLLPKVKAIVQKINSKCKKTSKTYRIIGTIISSNRQSFDENQSTRFLQEYENFEGAVTSDDLVQLDGLLSDMVGTLCGIIEEAQSASGSSIAVKVSEQGYCVSAANTVRRLITRYTGIAEEQDKIMMTFTKLAQTRVKIEAAKSLINITKTDLRSEFDREMTKLRSFFLLRRDKMDLIEKACNYITYLNHGRNLPLCNNIEGNLDMDLTALISYRYNQDMCSDHSMSASQILNIPITGNVTEKGSLQLNQLLQKSNDSRYPTKGSIFFQIPNRKWLVDHGWISPTEHGPFFVKEFEIFLPPSTNRWDYLVETDMQIIRNNIGSQSYIISTLNNLFQIKYRTSRLHHCSDKRQLYQVPGCNKTAPICVITPLQFSGPLYPSVTSTWKITVRSTMELPQIFAASGTFQIKANVRLCAPRKGLMTRQRRSFSNPTCCKQNQYYSQNINSLTIGKEPCQDCPTGSVSRLNRYFCERCPTGYEPGQMLYGCQPCAAGFYKGKEGAEKCVKCPTGKTSAVGQKSCV